MYLLISYSLGHILRPLVSAKPEFSGDNFLRGCKWWAYGPWCVEWDQPGFRVIQVSCCILSPQFTNRAPDGTCVLVCSNDNKLRLYNLPVELYSGVVKGLPDMVCIAQIPLCVHSIVLLYRLPNCRFWLHLVRIQPWLLQKVMEFMTFVGFHKWHPQILPLAGKLLSVYR